MIHKITAAIAALLISAGWADAQVTLEGTGTVTAKPDIAYVTLTVVTEGKVAADATKDNTASVTTLCAAVEGVGIKKDDIKTGGFYVSPKMHYANNEEPKIVGYVVTNSLNVTVRDLKVLGSLIDKSIVGGANRVSSVRFDVTDKKSLFAQARKNAVADAKAKAALYAEAGGFKLGEIKSIVEHRVYEDDGQRSEAAYVTRSASQGRQDVPISNPTDLKYQVVVTVAHDIVK